MFGKLMKYELKSQPYANINKQLNIHITTEQNKEIVEKEYLKILLYVKR